MVLPRLVQHLASFTPRDIKTMVPGTGGTGEPSKREWLEMSKQKDDGLLSIPSQAYRVDRTASDEFVCAVEGKPIHIEGGL